MSPAERAIREQDRLDRFAAAALQGLLAGKPDELPYLDPMATAERAWGYAVRMIAQEPER